jgi:cytosine/uracil/thiamine/allantoin permease
MAVMHCRMCCHIIAGNKILVISIQIVGRTTYVYDIDLPHTCHIVYGYR